VRYANPAAHGGSSISSVNSASSVSSNVYAVPDEVEPHNSSSQTHKLPASVVLTPNVLYESASDADRPARHAGLLPASVVLTPNVLYEPASDADRPMRAVDTRYTVRMTSPPQAASSQLHRSADRRPPSAASSTVKLAEYSGQCIGIDADADSSVSASASASASDSASDSVSASASASARSRASGAEDYLHVANAVVKAAALAAQHANGGDNSARDVGGENSTAADTAASNDTSVGGGGSSGSGNNFGCNSNMTSGQSIQATPLGLPPLAATATATAAADATSTSASVLEPNRVHELGRCGGGISSSSSSCSCSCSCSSSGGRNCSSSGGESAANNSEGMHAPTPSSVLPSVLLAARTGGGGGDLPFSTVALAEAALADTAVDGALADKAVDRGGGGSSGDKRGAPTAVYEVVSVAAPESSTV
jgi:epidermal growth factor receptor substrate 15